MEILSAYGAAFTHIFEPQTFLYLVMGLVTGVIVGILPGIGIMTGVALFMPFVFYLTPWPALAFLIAFVSVTNIGGTVTTYVMGIPGESSNMPGLMDGFAMAKKGECARALGAAQTGSFLGALYTVIWALIMIPLVQKVVMLVTSAEMVFFILMGIAMIVTLSTGSMTKGLISGVLGLSASMVGYHIITAQLRFTFGALYLYDGLPLLPVMLGLFAVTEVYNMMVRQEALAEAQKYEGWQGVRRGVKDVFKFWRLNLISSFIGYMSGLIPGVGSSIGGWVTYGVAKAISKHPEEFGKGTVEGVIGPESANDGKEAGSILTMFAIGMPSGAAHVMILAALIILGLTPGPELMRNNVDIVAGMVMIRLLTAGAAVTITLIAAPTLAKLAYVPIRWLAPLVIVFVFIGVYADDQLYPDLITTLVFGVIGVAMQKFGFSRPALVLGFILGSLFEKYLFISFAAYGYLFFLQKTSTLVLIVITIAVIAWGPLMQRRAARMGGA